MDTATLSSLHAAGLSDKEARVYLAMLELGESGIIPIARLAGIKRTTVYNYLEDFRRLGLIRTSVRNARTYYLASSPTRLRDIAQERAQMVESAIPGLLSLYKEEEGKPSTEMFEGVEGIKAVFNMSLTTEHKSIDAIPVYASGHGHVGDEFIARYLEATKKQGIAYRTLRLQSDLPLYANYRLREPQEGDNREIRIAPEWFKPESHIHLYDDKVAIFSQTKEMPYAMLITSQSFAQTMKMFFEGVWGQAEILN